VLGEGGLVVQLWGGLMGGCVVVRGECWVKRALSFLL
jgi:hypothetical protein